MREAAPVRSRRFSRERTMLFCAVTPINNRECSHELGSARMNSGVPV